MQSLAKTAAAAVALTLGALLLAGCESTDLTADPSGEILVFANPNPLVINDSQGETQGQTQIVAQVFDEGNFGMGGVDVLFSTTGGTLASAGVPITTDNNGIARDLLTVQATDVPPFEVTARSGTVTGTVTVTRDVTSGRLTLIANPNPAALDGFGTETTVDVNLIATVERQDGSPWDGVDVTFTADGATVGEGVTTSNGSTSTTFTVRASDAPFVEATATAMPGAVALSDTQTVTINTGSIEVTADPRTVVIPAGQTEESTTITATLTDKNGTAAFPGAVFFATTAGTLSDLMDNRKNTNQDGLAVVTLTLTNSDPNSVTVTASTELDGGGLSASVTVTKSVATASAL